MYRFSTLAALLLLVGTLFAYNHPEITWKSVSTEHFIINFSDATEPAVYATWKIAEESYTTLAELFNYQIPKKITLSLAEYEDYSNGYAEWTSANIMIWLPDLQFSLRSNTTWLRNVITHELGHIISLHANRNTLLLASYVQLGISTPTETYGFTEPFAHVSIYPSWLTEGITQLETASLGNDCWDSRREMVLRSAVMSNRALSLDEMGVFNHDALGNEMVYNQGFAFTRYLAEKVGNRPLCLFFKAGSAKRITFSNYFTEKTGLSLSRLYDSWTDSLRANYAHNRPPAVTSHEFVGNQGRFNLLPKVSPDGNYLAYLSNLNDDGDRTDLLVFSNNGKKPRYHLPYAHTDLAFSSTGEQLYFIKSRTPNKNGAFLNDIFSLNLKNGRVTRVTTNGRIYAVAPHPNGIDLLCIAYRQGAFGIYRCTSNGVLTAMVAGTIGEPFTSITTCAQQPSTAILAKTVSGQSRLFTLSLDNMRLQPLGPGVAQEESPFWAENGRIYYSADYDGIFNLYSLQPDGSGLLRHTTTSGGYFSPCLAHSGELYSSYYNASGFSIVKMVPQASPYSLPEKNHCTFERIPMPPGKVSIKARPYTTTLQQSILELSAIGQLQKNSSLLFGDYTNPFDTSIFVIGGTLASSRSDALHKKSRYLALTVAMQGITAQTQSAYAAHANVQTNDVLALPAISGHPATINHDTRTPLRKRMQEKTAVSLNNWRHGPFTPSRQSAETDGNTESNNQSPIAFGLLPRFAWESSSYTPTIGFTLDAQFSIFLMPSHIATTAYSTWQIGREWFTGIDITLESNPYSRFSFYGSAPLSLQWQRIGTINEDIGYNGAGVTRFSLAAGPRSAPAITPDDTITTGGWMAALTFYHGFPLAKYGSFMLGTSTYATYHAIATSGDDQFFFSNGGSSPSLGGFSNSYLLSQNSAEFRFPLIRTINHGTTNYFDALYGTIGYTLYGYTNSSIFDGQSNQINRIFSKSSLTSASLVIGHFISAGVELGHYKSYLFFQKLVLTISHELLRNETYFSLTKGF